MVREKLIIGKEQIFVNFENLFSREYHHLSAQVSVEGNSKSTII